MKNKLANQNKSTRGRRAGQLAKAHKTVPDGDPQAAYWQHMALATTGDYPPDVSRVVFLLGKLAAQYDTVLRSDRAFLEMNRRKVEIPLPRLPQGENFKHPQLFQESAHDVIWIMSFLGYHDALRLLGFLIRAAATKDVKFFEELVRRVKNAVNTETSLSSPAEPLYSALADFKYRYGVGPWRLDKIRESLQGDEDIKITSDRTLSNAAKLVGILIVKPGRPKTAT